MEQYDEALEIIAAIDSENQIKSFNQLLHFYAGLLLDKKQRYEQAWTHFKAIEVKQPEDIEILNKSDEKTVQKFSSEEIDPSIKFVFADPATGQQDFVHWLAENNIAAIDNRNSGRVRDDVFTKDWTVRLLGDLNEAQIHFLRKKYIKKLRTAVDTVPESMVDFLPFSPINAAIIKRVFPQSQVLILSRNFADLRLNNRVFGTHRAHYLEFSKIANQMIAMNPNVSLVDIDAWQNQDEAALTNIQKMFGKDVVPFSLTETQPLNRVIFPFMHWKNYQKFLNTEQKSS